jgi:hypothetical protein
MDLLSGARKSASITVGLVWLHKLQFVTTPKTTNLKVLIPCELISKLSWVSMELAASAHDASVLGPTLSAHPFQNPSPIRRSRGAHRPD